jgi:hypothetical protein
MKSNVEDSWGPTTRPDATEIQGIQENPRVTSSTDVDLRRIQTRQIAAFAASGAAIMSHWPLRRLDVDLLHDGYVTATAIAIAEGRTPHVDVFMLYGPVMTHIQALAIRLSGAAPVLTLRSLSVILIAAISGLIALSGSSRHESDWPIPAAAGPIAAIAWLLLSDAFTWVAIFPWVSLWVAASLLVVLNLVRIAVEATRERTRAVALSGAGFVSASLLLSRPAIGIAVLGLFCLGATLKETRTLLKPLLLAFLVSLFTIGGLIGASKWGSEFFRQVFAWPIEAYLVGGNSSGNLIAIYRAGKTVLPELACIAVVVFRRRLGFTSEQLFLMLMFLTILKVLNLETLRPQVAFVAAIVSVIAVASIAAHRYSATGTLRWVNAFLALLIVGALPATGGGVSWFRASSPETAGAGWVTRVFVDVSTNTLYLVFFSATLLAVFVILGKVSQRNASTGTAPQFVIAALALASVGEVLSIADTRHVWWALPIGLLLVVASVMKNVGLPRRPMLGLVVAGALIVTAAATSSSLAYATQSRVFIEDGVAAGMKAQEGVYQQYRDDLQLMRELGDQPMVFYVSNAMITVMDGKFQDSPALVAWGADVRFEDVLESQRIIVATRLINPEIERALTMAGFSVDKISSGYTVFVVR